MTALAQNVEPERDQWGRPKVVTPDGKKKIGYRRVTTFVGVLEGTDALTKWKMRLVAEGMGKRPDLVTAAAANAGDKDKIGKITDQAFEAAGGSTAATTGSAIHLLAEKLDRGELVSGTAEWKALPSDVRADLDAYRRAMEPFRIIGREQFRVLDDLQVAGTMDTEVELAGSGLCIPADMKTGQSMDYGMLKIAMQLACYAHGTPYDVATHTRGERNPRLSLDTGLVIHLAAGKAQCDLIKVDIAAGWEAVQTAIATWQWRDRSKKLSSPWVTPTIRDWTAEVATTTTLDALRALWAAALEAGVLTPALSEAMTSRAATIQAVIAA